METSEWLDMMRDVFRGTNTIKITDPRDIAEIERRKKLKSFGPARNELYTFNPEFNGIYSDPENRTPKQK